ncbi:DUF2381 family protein [Archangium violaceum]|uniref:Uncharacterized protein n=1 Tax=Archangium violaceum Cb vi76 TaxID=1406225 RepID=A0A084SF74_9BACT|nr:DUF2381 family protein [Archangium violaceum]KFA87109.1 hypothetical protein Q664_49995 [Archangium violaceum Cb vi76]
MKVAVNEAEGLVTLLPTQSPPPDRPLLVTVRFADGQVPGSVTLRLVEDALRAEHQVRVYRQPRSGESWHLESRQQRERAERCEAALAQERARPQGPCAGGLLESLGAGLVGRGRASRRATSSATSPSVPARPWRWRTPGATTPRNRSRWRWS